MENNENIKKAKEKVDEFVADDEARILIELREKWEMDYKSSMASARRIGHKEGLEKGLEKGREEGAKQEKINMAKILLSKKFSIEEIEEITGLTKEEIYRLK